MCSNLKELSFRPIPLPFHFHAPEANRLCCRGKFPGHDKADKHTNKNQAQTIEQPYSPNTLEN